jgi:MerR family transcriptional regulator, light-induced transcriptional regulator
VAARTGVGVPTLRAWEARHGFPQPRRLSTGHRRYGADDVRRIEMVLRARAAGLSLEAAIAEARQRTTGVDRSIFSGLRARRPDLPVHVVEQPVMLAISRAIEDECCAAATHPVLAAGFQHDRFYRRSRPRWRELARTSRLTVVLGDFGQNGRDGDVLKVNLPRPEPLRREWAVVCHAPDANAVLTGWEVPGRGHRRRFEATWSAEPAVVVAAVRIALELGHSLAPDLIADLHEMPAVDEDPAHTARRATGLTNRVIAYLSRR